MPSALSDLPELVWRKPPADRRPRYLTPVYGSIRTAFSGSTWHFAHAAVAEGAIDGAFGFDTEARPDLRLKASAGLWKTARLLRGRKTGGYKFVAQFHDLLWSRHLERFSGSTIINNTQIFGPAFLRRHRELEVNPTFYIDGTLSEYFHSYGAVEDQNIGQDVMARAIDLEQEGYAHARMIFTMSRASAEHLRTAYGVSAERIKLLIPGANIDDAVVPAPSAKPGWRGREFTLGFVGLFPGRKGLDKLAAALAILRSRRLPVRLKVIGRCPDAIAAQDGVTFLGRISKNSEAQRFVSELQTCDLGCQLSRAELLGIAMMEFLRLGVPVLATSVGGMPDVLEGGGGVLVSPDVTAEQLAEEIQRLVQDESRYEALQAAAAARAEWASWSRTARELDAALDGAAGTLT